MRKILFSLIFVILFSNFISAEILINEQPKQSYNVGDTINIPVKITTSIDLGTFFTITLICNGIESVIHKEYVQLSAGAEKKINSSIPLLQNLIGRTTGSCKFKAALETGEIFLTNDFKITDKIIVKRLNIQESFSPGENLIIEGEAIKENKKPVEGFVSIEMIGQNSSGTTNLLETVSKGYFYIEYLLPEDIKAGAHNIKLKVYEKDTSEQITNKGEINYNIRINQIPTSLEIVVENPQIEPGTDLKIKTILHDQTGGKIESDSIITIEKGKKNAGEQFEQSTNDILEYPIIYNEPPAKWKIKATSNELESEMTLEILEKQAIKTEIINKTLLITNKGNVAYNKTILIKIGETSRELSVLLDVDEEQKYFLTAPEGKYQVEIIADGENQLTEESVLLTGKVIDVKKSSTGVFSFVRYPIVWIFIIAILGFVSYTLFKKGYKRSFFGYIHRKKISEIKPAPLSKHSLINTTSKAELSLSIKGDKQSASLVCLRIKNLKEIESSKSNAKEVLQKIVNMAEKEKTATYENQSDLFFIIAPIKTKTFRNEKTAFEIAQKINQILIEYNKLAKQKIEFGISLNYGAIIAKLDKEKERTVMKFMSIGTLITTARKIASVANKEILLGEKINEKLMTNIKTDKHKKDNLIFYSIKEIKRVEDHSRFLGSFLHRMEKEQNKK